jgi:hypothetical protein
MTDILIRATLVILSLSTMTHTDHPLLVISNTHALASGMPPGLTNADPTKYLGYFVNEHGDQWVFVFDCDTHRATLYGGDMGWTHQLTIASSTDFTSSVTESERAWLEACWRAATVLPK